MPYQTYCSASVYLLKCMNMEDQVLQRKKEIRREKERKKRKNEHFSNEKEVESLHTENYFSLWFWLQLTRFLPTAVGLVAKAGIFRWPWSPCPGLQAVRRNHAQKERVDRRQWAFEGLQQEFPPDRFCVRPVMLQNETTEWSFSKHFTGIDLSLLLLTGRTAELPEYISPCHLSVPTEIS